MGARARVKQAVGLVLLTFGPSWAATTPPERPRENYKGPIAERPMVQRGDYWVYERGNLTKAKSTVLPPNIGFPLWIGKTWNYESEARTSNQPPTATASPMRAQIDCSVTRFDQVAVKAGTFGAFQCECQCQLLTGVGFYQDGCGSVTVPGFDCLIIGYEHQSLSLSPAGLSLTTT